MVEIGAVSIVVVVVVVDYVMVDLKDETDLVENAGVKFALVNLVCGNFEVSKDDLVVKTESVVEDVNQNKNLKVCWLQGRKRAKRRSFLED